jgi:hypothetical protein
MNAVTAIPAVTQSVARLQTAFALQGGASLPVRQQAFEKFRQCGFPTTHDEHWKYTNLRRLEAHEFSSGQPDTAYTPSPAPADAYQLVFVDGFFRTSMSTLPQSGLSITSLAELQTTASATLNEVLTTAANEAAALWRSTLRDTGRSVDRGCGRWH